MAQPSRGPWWKRALAVAYCYAAGAAFSLALQALGPRDAHWLDQAIVAALFSPLTITAGWGCAGIIVFWPVLAALVVLHFRRPSTAGLLALSLWTAAGHWRAIEGLQMLNSV